jgi:hypothetical protein
MTQTAPTDRVRREPDRHFPTPLALVDRDDIAYETRLDMLQTWLSRHAEGAAARGSRSEIEGAILALEARAKLKTDTPQGQPVTTTYGGVARSDLRDYGLRRLLARLRGVFRR